MKKNLVFSLIVLSLMIFAPISAYSATYVMENSFVDQQAPEFTLPMIGKDKQSLSQLRDGQQAIIFFWATWCPHCRTQLKELNKQATALQAKGIKIMTVDVGESSRQVEAYLKKNGIQLDVFLDENTEVSEMYEIIGVPTFFYIDKNGVVKAVEHEILQNYEDVLSGVARQKEINLKQARAVIWK